MPGTVTYEEGLHLPEVQDATDEVVHGEIRIYPPNRLIHAECAQNLGDLLVRQFDKTDVRVATSQFGLVVREAPLTCRVPDWAIFKRETFVVEDGFVRSAPQLAAEVLSPEQPRNVCEEKLKDYAEIGTPEVWVVSPEARTVEVLLLADGRYRRSAILAEGPLKPVRFSNVQINIAQIWPD